MDFGVIDIWFDSILLYIDYGLLILLRFSVFIYKIRGMFMGGKYYNIWFFYFMFFELKWVSYGIFVLNLIKVGYGVLDV